MFWKTKYTSSVLRHSSWVIASLTFPILSDKSHKKWNIRKYMEKYSVHIRGNMHCIFGDMFITYLGAALSDQGWGGHWGPDFLWDAWSGRAIQGQTVGTKRHLHFVIQTNIFCHLDKYILPFGQIYFDQGWAQIPFGISLVELSNTRTDSGDKRDKRVEGQSTAGPKALISGWQGWRLDHHDGSLPYMGWPMVTYTFENHWNRGWKWWLERNCESSPQLTSLNR